MEGIEVVEIEEKKKKEKKEKENKPKGEEEEATTGFAVKRGDELAGIWCLG